MILINFHQLNHYDYNQIFRMPDEILRFARLLVVFASFCNVLHLTHYITYT